jgi:hypothetical protein
MGKVCSEPIPDEMRIRKNMSTLPVCNVYPSMLSRTLLTSTYVCAEADEEVWRVASE